MTTAEAMRAIEVLIDAAMDQSAPSAALRAALAGAGKALPIIAQEIKNGRATVGTTAVLERELGAVKAAAEVAAAEHRAEIRRLEKRNAVLADHRSVSGSASVVGRLGASAGGIARRDALSPERRHEIARKAAQARWNKP